MGKVRLEILAWLSGQMSSPSSERLILEEEVKEGETVKDLLNRLAAQHQVFREFVFDVKAQELTSVVSVIYNGRLLELVQGIQTPLKDGDNLMFLPAFSGGAGASCRKP